MRDTEALELGLLIGELANKIKNELGVRNEITQYARKLEDLLAKINDCTTLDHVAKVVADKPYRPYSLNDQQ